MGTSGSNRILSIDVFRGVTMLLMIWVNDFWTLHDVPKWLEHASATEDYLGFSDLIFPWFLFIVGLSIPFALNIRLKRGESQGKILRHILLRALALLIMGVFLVNTESYHAEATGLAKPWFTIILISAFFLIWNVYPKANSPGKKFAFVSLQLLGIILLAYLAIIYRGNGNDPDTVVIMQTRWWGILGIIGWVYLIAAPIYLLLHKYVSLMWVFLLLFIMLNIVGNSGVSYNVFPWQDGNWVIGNGAFHAFTFAGIVTSGLLIHFQDSQSKSRFYIILSGLSIIFLIAGIISEGYFIISKIVATPPWIFYSLASALALFSLFYWFIDQKGISNWFNIIKPAGTATLTCYLIPYYFYSIGTISGISLPDFLDQGIIGLLKSLIYALLIVGITGLLIRIPVKLKI